MNRGLPVALAAALLTLMLWEVHDFVASELAEVPRRPPVPALIRDVPEFDASEVAQGWVGIALERPLFRENRRPLKASSTVALEADEPMRLTGVIIGPFGNRAIFMSGKNAKPIVMMEGSSMGGLTVRSIETGQATIQSGGNFHTMKPTFVEEEFPMPR